MNRSQQAAAPRESRPLTPAGWRVLEVASGLFYREGIHAVGVEAIAAGAGVTKKTLYACFGSKDRLVAAYLSARDERWREWLTRYVGEHGGSARERVLASFDALAEWIEREDPRGCGFVNALAELPSPEHPGRAVITAQKRWLLEYLTGLAAGTGAPDPQELGRSLLLLHEGATVASAAGTVPDAARRARETARALLPPPDRPDRRR
ncbi:TetR/AcrR family transcriptional regulator [Allonocardiopsis opalescens]|uniref:TetR family transcriptional regulator n=1 Tax=Allonocardiopsis opalescens TaxID=1144618 RepID=A0A2T0Q4Q1_9ACTN|nr:TetR/AcrR family transcriptional regulator [Allonocardiopsis opalescens]PRX98729.1 TetR family transcriptional regulator [Allonocardiopsis opalescens]